MASKLCPAVTFVALLIAFTHSGGAQRFPQQRNQQQQYSSGQQQYSSGQQQYSSGQQQYSSGQQQYSSGQQQYSSGQPQYSSGQQQYNNAPGAVARQGAAFNCPERYGYYANPSQCDAYYKCSDGVASEELCPDGLLFNDKASPFTFPCQYPNDVTCEGRSALQPAQPTEQCPHQYGYFKLGDAQNCGQFVNCAAGRGYVIDCPDGLAFDERTYHCDWPDKVESCDAEAYLGFRCPEESRLFNQGEAEYRYFRSPNDCQKYFICVEGRPRRYNCGEGRAYNELISACDGIENVTGCALPAAARQQNLEGSFNYRG